MIHKLTEVLYAAAHARGYACELKCSVVKNGEGYGQIQLNLFDKKTKEPVFGSIMTIGDTNPDPNGKTKWGLVFNDIRAFCDIISYNDIMSIMNWENTTIMKALGDADVFDAEKTLNDNMCAINFITISDMSGIMGIDPEEKSVQDIFPHMEYNFSIGSYGSVTLLYDPEAVSNKSPKVENNFYEGTMLKEWLTLAGLSLTDPNAISVVDKKFETVMSRVTAVVMNPLYEKIYKTYATVHVK